MRSSYGGDMILIQNEKPDALRFENTDSGNVFDARRREGTSLWVVTRYGSTNPGIAPDTWGYVEASGGTWLAVFRDFPKSESMSFPVRDDALGWLTSRR